MIEGKKRKRNTRFWKTKVSFFRSLSLDSSKTRFNLRLFIFFPLLSRIYVTLCNRQENGGGEKGEVRMWQILLYEYSLVINFKGKELVFLLSCLRPNSEFYHFIFPSIFFPKSFRSLSLSTKPKCDVIHIINVLTR